MSEKQKTLFWAILLVVVLGAGSLIYGSLTKKNKPQNSLAENFVTETKTTESAKTSEETTKSEVSTEKTSEATFVPKSSAEETSEEVQNKEDFKAIDVNFFDREGNEVKLSDFYGKPIVMNFWASWCPPCKSEMPEFDKVYNEMGDEITFLMVNMTDGTRETKELAEKYLKGESFSFPIFYDENSEVSSTYQVTSIPTTYFISGDGYLVTRAVGAINEETLKKGIEMILE